MMNVSRMSAWILSLALFGTVRNAEAKPRVVVADVLASKDASRLLSTEKLVDAVRKTGKYDPLSIGERDKAFRLRPLKQCTHEACVLEDARAVRIAPYALVPIVKESFSSFQEGPGRRMIPWCNLSLVQFTVANAERQLVGEASVACLPSRIEAIFIEIALGKYKPSEHSIADIKVPSKFESPAQPTAALNSDVLLAYDTAAKAEADMASNDVLPFVEIANGLMHSWDKLSLLPPPNPYKDYAARRALEWATYLNARVPFLVSMEREKREVLRVASMETLPLDQKKVFVEKYLKRFGMDYEFRTLMYKNRQLWPLISDDPAVLLEGEWVAAANNQLIARVRFDSHGNGEYIVDNYGGVSCRFDATSNDGINIDVRFDVNRCSGEPDRLSSLRLQTPPFSAEMAASVTNFTKKLTVVERADSAGSLYDEARKYFVVDSDPVVSTWPLTQLRINSNMAPPSQRWRFKFAQTLKCKSLDALKGGDLSQLNGTNCLQ